MGRERARCHRHDLIADLQIRHSIADCDDTTRALKTQRDYGGVHAWAGAHGQENVQEVQAGRADLNLHLAGLRRPTGVEPQGQPIEDTGGLDRKPERPARSRLARDRSPGIHELMDQARHEATSRSQRYLFFCASREQLAAKGRDLTCPGMRRQIDPRAAQLRVLLRNGPAQPP
jgi:hypothetical protein